MPAPTVTGAPSTMPRVPGVVRDQRVGLAFLVDGLAVLDQLEGRHDAADTAARTSSRV